MWHTDFVAVTLGLSSHVTWASERVGSVVGSARAWLLCGMYDLSSHVVATRFGKQTHSEGQCREWSAVYYTGGPKAESPLTQGP